MLPGNKASSAMAGKARRWRQNPAQTVGVLVVLILSGLGLMSVAVPAEEMDIYDHNYRLQYRLRGDKIYDRDYRLQYRLNGDKIYDRNYRLQYRFEDGKIYDRHRRLQYRLDGDKVLDQQYRRRFHLQKRP